MIRSMLVAVVAIIVSTSWVRADEATKVKTIDLKDIPKYVPPHVGKGDKEFKGHGPRVKVSCELEIEDGKIYAKVKMNAIETQEDFTEVDGEKRFLVYDGPDKVIAFDKNQKSSSKWEYTDNDEEDDESPTMSEDEPVKNFICVGDTKGEEAGTRTGVTIRWRAIKAEVAAK